VIGKKRKKEGEVLIKKARIISLTQKIKLFYIMRVYVNKE